jgi:putative peptidoglycan lipid II flippase
MAEGLDPLSAIVVGVLVGGVLQVVAQWPSLRAIGYLDAPRFDFRAPVVSAVFRRMTPVLFGFGIYYIDVAVARHLLSELGPGPQSYFAFAQRICDFPQGIFVMAVQSATLPALAALSANGKWDALRDTFLGSARLALFVAIPATGAVVVLAEPLVSWVFERGHFDASAVAETAAALRAQGAGIWTLALVRQLVIVFYALGDTRSPVWISGLDFLVFLVAALGLREVFGHVGISWAVTVSGFAQVVMLWFQLKRRLKAKLSLRAALSGQYKLLVATFSAMLAAASILALEAPDLKTLGLETLRLEAGLGSVRGNGLVAGLAYGVVFLTLAFCLRCPELFDVLRPLTRRFKAFGKRAG